MTEHNPTPKYSHHSHQNRIIQAHNEDPYRIPKKWPEPTHCDECGAIYSQGRWVWGQASTDSIAHRCPACSRIKDKTPAGILTLRGTYIEQHKQEILNLITNVEQQERLAHPLERIMSIDDQQQSLSISFTGTHMAKATGNAIHHAHQGNLEIHFGEQDSPMRITWQR